MEKREIYRAMGGGNKLHQAPNHVDMSAHYIPEQRRNNKTMRDLVNRHMPKTRDRYKKNPLS